MDIFGNLGRSSLYPHNGSKTEAKQKQDGSKTNLRKVFQSKPLESFGKYSEWISIDLIVDALACDILSDGPATFVNVG